MASRLLPLLLCMSLATLLVMPLCCNSFRITGFTRSLLSSTSDADDDTEVPRHYTDDHSAANSATEKENEFHQWTAFQQVYVQEVEIDYNPPEANPDPANPSPSGD